MPHHRHLRFLFGPLLTILVLIFSGTKATAQETFDSTVGIQISNFEDLIYSCPAEATAAVEKAGGIKVGGTDSAVWYYVPGGTTKPVKDSIVVYFYTKDTSMPFRYRLCIGVSIRAYNSLSVARLDSQIKKAGFKMVSNIKDDEKIYINFTKYIRGYPKVTILHETDLRSGKVDYILMYFPPI